MEYKLKIKQPINILVQRRAAIGDTMMTTGVVRELKRRYGANANIDIATDCAEVYRNNPHIRNIFPVDQVPSVNGRYEQYINLDLSYEMNPQNSLIDSMFYRAFGSADFDKSIELFPDAADRAMVDQDLERIGKKFIVVHMRNWYWPAKNISMDVWFGLFEQLLTERTDFTIVCAGADKDYFVEDHPNFFDVRTRYNVQKLKYLCDHAACFVGIDSSPYWCAAASNTHIVSLMTLFHHYQTLPFRNGTQGDNCTAITTGEDCAGCWERQATPVRQPTCEKSTYPCTSNFDIDAIAAAILEKLK